MTPGSGRAPPPPPGRVTELGSFLRSPTSQSLDWPLAKARRQHVHNQIDHLELPVTHETLHRGTSQLRKTSKLFARARQAREQMTTDLAWLTQWGTPDAPGKKKSAQRVRK